MMGNQKTLAIDISHWRKVDWSLVPHAVKLVMIKATEGDYYIDEMLSSHVEGALESGKIVGLYHFYRTARNGRKVDPVAQAEFFLHHTREFQGEVHLRANDWERSHKLENGVWYNPSMGSEVDDLFNFHHRLYHSTWRAFTLLYTNLATWQTWKMENWKNGWQGPGWIKTEAYLNGLWVAAWGVETPSRLPRPFTQHWMHQFSASYLMPGIYNSEGKPSGVDANWIPHTLEQIHAQLGISQENSTDSAPVAPPDPQEPEIIFQRGWQARTDSLIEYLQASREEGGG